MIANILFILYMFFLGCAIPTTIGLDRAYKQSKIHLSDAVNLLVTKQTQYICLTDENCMVDREIYSSGTSFVVDAESDDLTIVMTAAHLCLPSMMSDPFEREIESIMPDLFRHSYEMLLIRNQQTYEPTEIMLVNEEYDICILKFDKFASTKLKLAEDVPGYAGEAYTIGAPSGFFPETAKPLVTGNYSGDAIRIYNNYESDFSVFSMPGTPGMSGSPILNIKGEVIGIISAVHVDWHMLTFSPTLEQLVDALDHVKEEEL